ncbi:MAG TPA: XRE family transcriptional regulator [Bacteroidetes bacterium]|nr:XRE family transcriptional regulator [Bacteroidota bacterium]
MNKYSIAKLPSDILMETARKHRDLRKQRKLSQALLAEKSGVSLGSLKRFEQTGKISFESLLKLAHILGRLSEFEAVFSPVEDLTEVEKLFTIK